MNPKNDGWSSENEQATNKIDEILRLLAQVLDKANNVDKRLDSIDKQLVDKADISVMKQMEMKLKKFEETMETRLKRLRRCQMSQLTYQEEVLM